MHALVDVAGATQGLRTVAAYRVWLPISRRLERGTRVRFVATLSASKSDPTFLIASDVAGQAILGS